ncbi:MAG TPA: MotA/TolQ/ExbB proton channel family protein [Bacteroidota bacterium]|nr:MotA/TolQ/ExbB proton channel family protein [Bacteroidota bacterium]
MKYIDLFFVGGVVMWPILLCSFAAVAVIVEKYISLRKAAIDPNQLLTRVRASLSHNDILGAVNACSEVPAPISTIMKHGLLRYNDGPAAVRKAIETAGKEEVFRLEKGLGLLANIAAVAPMLGFLGTVTGMIAAFQVIQNAGGNVNPGMLAGGIWEAMLTTAFGLIVGIPALGYYNYFVLRVTRFVFEIETKSEEFMDLIELDLHPRRSAPESVPPVREMPPATRDQNRRLFADDTEIFEPKKD